MELVLCYRPPEDFAGGTRGKEPPAGDTRKQVQSLEDLLEEGTATHSRILA